MRVPRRGASEDEMPMDDEEPASFPGVSDPPSGASSERVFEPGGAPPAVGDEETDRATSGESRSRSIVIPVGLPRGGLV